MRTQRQSCLEELEDLRQMGLLGEGTCSRGRTIMARPGVRQRLRRRAGNGYNRVPAAEAQHRSVTTNSIRCR